MNPTTHGLIGCIGIPVLAVVFWGFVLGHMELIYKITGGYPSECFMLGLVILVVYVLLAGRASKR